MASCLRRFLFHFEGIHAGVVDVRNESDNQLALSIRQKAVISLDQRASGTGRSHNIQVARQSETVAQHIEDAAAYSAELGDTGPPIFLGKI